MKDRRKEGSWRGREGGRESCLTFGGMLILLLGCYTSCHGLRFATSPLTHHVKWEHSSPVKPSCKRVVKKTQRMVQCWCLLAERELRTYMSCADTSDYNGSALSSHRMICASSPSITDTVWFINQNTWKGCLKTTYPVLHAFSSTYVMCVCVCVCVHHSYFSSWCSTDQCCHLLHWPVWMVYLWTSEGKACGTLALKMKVMMEKKNKTPEESRGFGSTNRKMCCIKTKPKSPTMIELERNSSCVPTVDICRDICGWIGITKKSFAFSECFVCYKNLKSK